MTERNWAAHAGCWHEIPDAYDLLERDLWDANRDAPDPDTHEQKEQPNQ